MGDEFLHRYGLTVTEAVSSLHDGAVHLTDDRSRAFRLVLDLVEQLLDEPPTGPVGDGRAFLRFELAKLYVRQRFPDGCVGPAWDEVVAAVGVATADRLCLIFFGGLTYEEARRRLGSDGMTVDHWVREVVVLLRRHRGRGTP